MTRAGLRVAALVPNTVGAKFDCFRFGDMPFAPPTGTYRLTGTIRLPPDRSTSIALFGEPSPQFVFERTGNGSMALHLQRDARAGMTDFAHDYRVPVGDADEVDVDLFADNGLVELSVGRGILSATNLFFPDEPAGRVTFGR